MRVAIIGTGAMACLFGARLAPHSDVCLLGSWLQSMEAISKRGICIEANDIVDTVQVSVGEDPQQFAPASVALLLVKSWQTERAASLASLVLAPDGIVVTLQNGLGNLEVLEERVGVKRAVAGVTTQGAALLSPGHVRYSGGGDTYLALRECMDERLQGLAGLFETAGFPTILTCELEPVLWGKLAVSSGINALTALLDITNGELLSRPDARGLMIAAAEETEAVAAALGIEIPFDVSEQVIMVAQATASNYSSMLQDMRRGELTEIESINCAIVREAALHGVPAPVNYMLCKLVRAARSQ
ncbi:MAG: ketopantoate reductase family protein [Anaerolineales bacterium]|nr:ketopantoate reductase family protein [Anaerolineales bacterium]